MKISREQYMDMYKVVGLALEVHSELGRGYAEPIYQNALEIEFQLNGLPYEREKCLKMHYKGVLLDKVYVTDFVYKDIMIELKAVFEVTSEHRAQLFNYMRITGANIGLLINFGEKSLRSERYLYDSGSDDFILLTKKNYLNYIEGALDSDDMIFHK